VHKKDPHNLVSWLGDFPGGTFSISDPSISELHILQNGFQFMLELISWTDIKNIFKLLLFVLIGKNSFV